MKRKPRKSTITLLAMAVLAAAAGYLLVGGKDSGAVRATSDVTTETAAERAGARVLPTDPELAVTWPAIERGLELLGCAKVLKVLDIGAVGSLLLEEIVNPAGHQLQMLHLAPRHGSRFAESPDGVGAEVIECV